MIKKIIVTSIFLPITLIAVVFALISQIDPNEYKEDIAAVVHKQTGGLLQIGGNIEMGFFPSLVFKLGETRFTPRGEEKALLSLKNVDLGVAVMPLLSGKVEVASIVIDGIEIYAAVNSQGVANWESLTSSDETSDVDITEDDNPTEQVGGQSSIDEAAKSVDKNDSPLAINIKKLAISHASLIYDDQQNNTQFTLIPFDLAGENINTDGEAFPFSVNIKAKLDDVISVDGHFQTEASIKLTPLNVQLINSELAIKLAGKDLPLAEHIINSDFNLVFNEQKLWLEPFNLQLDKTHFKGSLGVKDLVTQHIVVNVAGDQFNTDTYSAQQSAEENQTSTEQQANTEDTASTTTGDEELLPVETLKTLFFDIAISLDELIASGVRVENIQLAASGKDGRLALNNFSGQLYQGLIDASVEVDVNPQPPQFVINKKIENVQLQALLNDAADITQIEGVANFTMQLKTQGNSINAIKKNLNGPLDFEIYKSRINHVNLEKMVCQGVALINKESLSNNWSNYTEFTQMKGRVNFEDGTGDVKLQPAQLQNLKLNAEGEITLPEDMYDILLTLELNGDLSKRDKACRVNEAIDGAEWPVRCEGKFSDDITQACGLDKSGMAKILKQAARKEAVNQFKNKIKSFFGG